MFWMQRYEKHENQIKGCALELKVSDWQMNTWTWRAYDTVKARQLRYIRTYIRMWRMTGM